MRIAKIVIFFTALSGMLSAATVSYNPAPTTDSGWQFCGNLLGSYCDTTAYFDTNSLATLNGGGASISPLFVSAFDAWNNSVGDTWTLDDGGELTGTFNVTTAAAAETSFNEKGGVTIEVNIADIIPPAITGDDELVWVQGLYENYLLNGSIVTPFYQLDTWTPAVAGTGPYSATCGGYGPYPPTDYCAPAYPFQYSDNLFYDQPTALYVGGATQAFFNANAYLAVEDPDNDTLTVYDGISYGYQNCVGSVGNSCVASDESPEPDVWMLCGSGLLSIFLIRHIKDFDASCLRYREPRTRKDRNVSLG